MPIDKFRFVSPGVEIDEIDNSTVNIGQENRVGPVVIGRAVRGPALRPVEVRTFSDFIELFGSPVAGTQGGDIWRNGNYTAPFYGQYAAQAWLKNSTPLTYVRLLGDQHTSAQTSGRAGWDTDNTVNAETPSNGGAYGLFLIDSGSTAMTGTLAAIWYIQSGSILLSGSNLNGSQISGSAVLVESVGANKEFKAVIYDETETATETIDFNFSRSSDRFIRKVFNTNPIRTNSEIVSPTERKKYWLGETFERSVDTYVTSSNAGGQYGVILALEGSHAGDVSGGSFRFGNQEAETGWFFSQDLSNATGSFEPRDLQKLFRFKALYGGEWDSRNVKVSIRDIKIPNNDDIKYGTFSVVVRHANDTDSNPKILEQFNNVNLDPNSTDYIAARIGDRYTTWDDTKKRYTELGFYPNQSKFLRVEMNESVDSGLTNPSLLPFGFYGPLRHKGFSFTSGSTSESVFNDVGTSFAASFVQGATNIAGTATEGTEFINAGNGEAFEGAFLFPSLSLRVSASDGTLSDAKQSYYGVQNTTTTTSNKYDEGYPDYVRTLSGDYKDEAEGTYVEYSFTFTLDDISGSAEVPNNLSEPAVYVSGSRVAGTSISARNGWQAVLDNGHNRFTAPLYGGFDGDDITEMDPFRNSAISTSPTETSDSVFYTIKRAIESVRDPDVLEHALATVPGITNETLTNLLADVCEKRSDSLAIIDPKGGFVPRTENTQSLSARLGDTATIVSNMRTRGLNSSYAAAYEPWVKIRDQFSGQILDVPPSVVALGVLSKTERDAAPWFAPAGFTRGGLSRGDSGLDVVGVTRQLFSEDRDDLYEVGINPIAKFPAQGIVVWGQKTLQATPSALDRINVRRMVNYVKKEISRIAATTLFDPNVQVTWDRFTSRANPLLRGIQGQFGIDRFRLQLDSSTTTDDVRDRNAIYAKIFIQPTKAVEFIGIDFIITNSGASFED